MEELVVVELVDEDVDDEVEVVVAGGEYVIDNLAPSPYISEVVLIYL